MRPQYLGDSYDIVKGSLIDWLSEFGTWVTHPMFTEEFSAAKAAAFSRLLNTPLLSRQVLTPQTDREKYFSACLKAGNLFVDPDTGVRLDSCRGKKSVNYVFGEELVELCQLRPRGLTLVFDQSYSRGGQKPRDVQKKLRYFDKREIYGFVYDSHATFLLLGANRQVVERARKKLIKEGLPEWRLVQLG